jgi:hypothetical protein
MGRHLTTPEGAVSVSAKLPPTLQIGLHQLVLDRWKATGHKPSQNQLLIEAIQEYLKKCGVDISQIEHAVGKWAPKENKRAKVAKFPKKA